MKYYVVRNLKREVVGVLKHENPIITFRMDRISQAEFSTYLEFGIKLMTVGVDY